MAKSAYNPNSHQQKNGRQIVAYSLNGVPLGNGKELTHATWMILKRIM